MNIHHLELLAAFNGLKSFAKNLSNCLILLRMDNTTGIAYINKMGGTRFKSLNKTTSDIWECCQEKQIFILGFLYKYQRKYGGRFGI